MRTRRESLPVAVDAAGRPRRLCRHGVVWRVTQSNGWRSVTPWWRQDENDDDIWHWRIEAVAADGRISVLELVNTDNQWWLDAVLD